MGSYIAQLVVVEFAVLLVFGLYCWQLDQWSERRAAKREAKRKAKAFDELTSRVARLEHSVGELALRCR